MLADTKEQLSCIHKKKKSQCLDFSKSFKAFNCPIERVLIYNALEQYLVKRVDKWKY